MNENAPGYTQPPPPPPPPQAPAAIPPPPPAAAPVVVPVVARKSPGAAGFLSAIFPGIGHLYLGLYQRSFMIAGAFILAIFLVSGGGPGEFLGPAMAFIWFFGIIDAVRQARAINLGMAAEPGLISEAQLRKVAQGTGSLTWGVILVGLGLVWLIDRYVDIDWSFMHDWGFPLALILLGFVLIVTHISKKRRENESGVGLPPRSR